MSLKKEISQIKMHEVLTYPLERYAYINLLARTCFKDIGIYLRLRKDDQTQTVNIERIRIEEKNVHKTTLLGMNIGDKLIQPLRLYINIHVTIRRLIRLNKGIWTISKDDKYTLIERVR